MVKASIKHEILRKSIHLTSLWIPITYILYGQNICFILLIIATIGMLIIDLARISKGKLNHSLMPLLQATKIDQVFRLHENNTLSGASYMLVGALFSILIFNQTTFVTAYTILMISDTLAAIIGLSFGKHKLIGNKTIEGTLAFFISALTIALIFGASIYLAIIACIFTTIAELFAKKLKIDDNLLVPLSYGITLLVFQELAALSIYLKH
jgi:dolichol kinase